MISTIPIFYFLSNQKTKLQISHCYTSKGVQFAEKLMDLLNNQASVLDADMRLVRKFIIILFE